jgi:hypothetical protein
MGREPGRTLKRKRTSCKWAMGRGLGDHRRERGLAVSGLWDEILEKGD